MDDLVDWLDFDHREGLVRKLLDDLVNGEHHHSDAKGSGFGALG